MLDAVLISSFEHSYFSSIHSYYRKFKKLNALRIAPIQENYLSEEKIIELCKKEEAYSFHPNESLVTYSLIDKLKIFGFKIFPYTINDEKRMEDLIKMGVNGIISDEPKMLWEVIQKFYK